MTTVYSKFPPTVENVLTWMPKWRKESRARTLAHLHARNSGKPHQTRAEEVAGLAPLPWQAKDLIGTTWVNAWTGGLSKVIAYEVPTPKYRPNEGKCLICENSINCDSYKDTLGFWMYDRYIIEYWLRYDHLSHQGKMEWMCLGVSHIQDKIAQTVWTLSRYHPERTSCYASNKKHAEATLARLRVARAKAVEELRVYCDLHDLDTNTPIDQVNAGIKAGGQLMLL